MRKRTLPALAAIALLFALLTPTSGAETVYGVWLRDGHEEQMDFFDCNGALCAKGSLPMKDGSESPMILRQAQKVGPNHWKGELFNPENGKSYDGEIKFEPPSKLKLTGCLIGFLCGSESWTKIAPLPAPAPAPKRASEPKELKESKEK
ncbi:MAG TPA: DUF2147 domain-containing protein [Methylocystis sp.]|nr:DUF2147 domain-containing protein [Methylocystis sp.]